MSPKVGRQVLASAKMYSNADMHSKHIDGAFTSCLPCLALILSICLNMSGVILFVEGLLYSGQSLIKALVDSQRDQTVGE